MNHEWKVSTCTFMLITCVISIGGNLDAMDTDTCTVPQEGIKTA